MLKRFILWLVGHKHSDMCGYCNCWDVQFKPDQCYSDLVGGDDCTDFEFSNPRICAHGWKEYDCTLCSKEA